MALMTRRHLLAAAATVVAASGARKSLAQDFRPLSDIAPEPPTALPTLHLTGLDGAPLSLLRFRGKPLVVNFWATWCGPCVAELPELDKLAESGTVGVLAVSADRQGATRVAPFVAAHGITHLTVALDPASDAVHALQVAGFPTTLILDAAGQVRGRLEGPAAWGGAGAAIAKLTADSGDSRG